MLSVADAITALGVYNIRPSYWNLDVLVGGSQKGFLLPPGLFGFNVVLGMASVIESYGLFFSWYYCVLLASSFCKFARRPLTADGLAKSITSALFSFSISSSFSYNLSLTL